MRGYRTDLAYVHDAGFRDYALKSAPGLLRILRGNGTPNGLVVDLGCGSGRWAAELNRRGYRVLGVDQSRAMIGLARRIAPGSTFRAGSLFGARLPECDAITCIGECLNYCFDAGNSRGSLRRLFRRAYAALRPGGIFVFDVAERDRLGGELPRKSWFEGRDWAILVEVSGGGRDLLRRRIVCFRKVGKSFRRSEEVHVLRLYQTHDLIRDLKVCGFETERIGGYGRFKFPAGISGIVAIKP